MQKLTKTFQYGDHEVTLETGQIARQAGGSVVVKMADTVVMVTVVGRKEADPGRPFFPLTVNYQEKFYAAGRIPGGFFKREGRPSEKETLTCRLIDRPIRPLFPKSFRAETQIICTVKSLNPAIDPEIPALIGTSAALAISGAPFQGPIGAARGCYKDGSYILNGRTGLEESDLDLVVAGTENAMSVTLRNGFGRLGSRRKPSSGRRSTPTAFWSFPGPMSFSRPSCWFFRCNCWPITSPCCGAG